MTFDDERGRLAATELWGGGGGVSGAVLSLFRAPRPYSLLPVLDDKGVEVTTKDGKRVTKRLKLAFDGDAPPVRGRM